MVSGIPTASGYEERIRFSEMEIVDRGANEKGLLVNMPDGQSINSWDVNVAAVRTTSVRRTVRYHQHAVGNILCPCCSPANPFARNSFSVYVKPTIQTFMSAEGMAIL